MIIGKNKEGKAVLLRCGCSHDIIDDDSKYLDRVIVGFGCHCRKCRYYGWRITGMTDEELRRREID